MAFAVVSTIYDGAQTEYVYTQENLAELAIDIFLQSGGAIGVQDFVDVLLAFGFGPSSERQAKFESDNFQIEDNGWTRVNPGSAVKKTFSKVIPGNLSKTPISTTFDGFGLANTDSETDSAPYEVTKVSWAMPYIYSNPELSGDSIKTPVGRSIQNGSVATLITADSLTLMGASSADTYAFDGWGFGVDSNGKRYPTRHSTTFSSAGETYMDWDGSEFAQEIRNSSGTESSSFNFISAHSATLNKVLLNQLSTSQRFTSLSGLSAEGQGLMLMSGRELLNEYYNTNTWTNDIETDDTEDDFGMADENNVVYDWGQISFNGIVDTLQLSKNGTWTNDPSQAQFVGSVSYTSTEKNPYIADALNSAFEELEGQSFDESLDRVFALYEALESNLLEAMFFGNDTISVLSTAAWTSNNLRGYDGNDVITAGVDKKNANIGGNDTLDGGSGRDTLTGGGGSDIFFFESGDSPALANRADRITDFRPGSDSIQISGTGMSGVGGASSLVAKSYADGRLKASKAFRNDAVDVFIQRIGTTGDGLIFADLEGNNTADFSVILTGVFTSGSPATIAGSISSGLILGGLG
jgi:Ca2+-binding RTX toxin-like protein